MFWWRVVDLSKRETIYYNMIGLRMEKSMTGTRMSELISWCISDTKCQCETFLDIPESM